MKYQKDFIISLTLACLTPTFQQYYGTYLKELDYKQLRELKVKIII